MERRERTQSILSERSSVDLRSLRGTVSRNVRRLGKTKNSPPLKLVYDHRWRYCVKIVPARVVARAKILTKADIEKIRSFKIYLAVM